MSVGRPPDETPDAEGWEAAGERVGASLDGMHLVLVLGLDQDATARAALGVARAQSTRRRVALGDLLGHAEPIERLLQSDDPHGLVDSFLYGVSINKIAQPVAGAGELYVLPSGSEMPVHEEIFTNSRWQRLASGFRETGALLIVAAPADAPHVDDVVRLGDGAVLVGDVELSSALDGKLLGRVRPVRAETPTVSAAVPADATLGLPLGTSAPARRRSRFTPAALTGIALAVTLAAVGLWLAARPFSRSPKPARNTGSAAGTLSTALDSARADSIAETGTSAAGAALAPANPQDSAASAAYAVALMTMNTQAGAIGWFQTTGRDLPAATFSPLLVQGAPWFRVLVGAYANRAQADSLLGALRARGEVRPGAAVVWAPFAFLVDSVTAEAVPGLLKYFADRGQPVYALRQADGSARLYAGAFESRDQASLFLESVRASGIRAVLVYRIGRVN